MAKPPPVTRVKIICTKDCAVADLGPTMLRLSEAGFEDIRYDFYTDVPKYKERGNHDTSSHVRLAEWIKDHPTFKARDVVKAFTAEGRTAGAAYTAIRMLCENKTLKKLGEGNYSRTDIKAIPAPKPKSQPLATWKSDKPVKPKPQATARKKHEISGPTLILRTMSRSHGRISSATLKKHFVADGRTANATGPSLSQLLKKKLITRVSEGLYELVKAQAKAPKPPKEKPATTNGNGAHPVMEEAAHG